MSTTTTTRRSDVYSRVTSHIIEELERGTRPWLGLGMRSMSPGGLTGPCDTTARNTPASTSSSCGSGRGKGLCLAVLDDLSAGPGAWADS